MIEQAHLPTSQKKPFRRYKREQARLSRHILYPVTAFYTLYSIVLFYLAARSKHPYIAIAFYVAALPIWTYLEYLAHRFILHGTFRRSKHSWKVYKTLANKFLDPLHWEHHKRPFDGLHINGELHNLLPVFAVSALLSFIFPLYTVPMLVAGIWQFYCVEEWVHHSVHYYNLRDPYFRYMKKHHFYHHTSNGMTRGFGLTSGIWDRTVGTAFSEAVRERLYGRRKPTAVERTERSMPQT